MKDDETEKGRGKTAADGGDGHTPEWRTADPLLNAPGRLARLVETTLILSAITGVIYAWGLTYYHAFSDALGLGRYHFAFQVQPQEAVVAGAYVMMYLIGAAPIFFGSVAAALVAVIAVAAAAHFAAGLLRGLWRWAFSKLMSRRRGRRRAPEKGRPHVPSDAERAFERIGRAAEVYFVFGVFTFLLIMILRWGDAEAAKFGTEVANRQLAACPKVEVTFGENQKVDSGLCGRIGGDYILKAPQQPQGSQDRYVIVKEAAVKQITVR